MTEKRASELYKTCSSVAMADCYVGGKWCTTCMYMLDRDQNFRYYDNMYCMAAEKKIRRVEKMNDNYETVKAIANELDAIVKGDAYVCPECGEIVSSYHEYADAEGYPRYKCKCGCDTDTEPEQATLYDHALCMDPFDIEYRVGHAGEYRSVKIMIACGGPNIYIDSASGAVELHWWTEHAQAYLAWDTVETVNQLYEDIYSCLR